MHNKDLSCSVAMATYNGEQFILEQLESIVNQSVLPNEIVISDDGSSDKTVSIINQFMQEHKNDGIDIRLIKNQKGKRGVLGNFENAIINTTGDIIFLSDQDDIWIENKVESVMSIFKENSVDMVFHDSLLLVKNGEAFEKSTRTLFSMGILNQLNQRVEPIKKSGYINMAAAYCFIQGMCMAVSRNLLNHSYPFPACSRNHDAWFLFCGIATDSCIATKEVLAYYRIHDNNTCGIAEYNKKRKIKDKVATFNERSLSSIREEYNWSSRVYEFLGYTFSDLNPIQSRLCSFNMEERIDIIRKNRLIAVFRLTKAYFSQKYGSSGKIVYFHDLSYCLLHGKKYRKKYINSFLKK